MRPKFTISRLSKREQEILGDRLVLSSRKTPTGCIVYTKSRRTRYAMIKPPNIHTMALGHRISYELFVGPIPPDLLVCHFCDNPKCIAPEHLFVGTDADNIHDMWFKGRGKITHHCGERHGQSKATESIVVQIRSLYATGKHTQQSLADRFSLSKGAVKHILKGRSWKHVQCS